ncbi:hypothetical protein FBALC1_16912 [Flavobacteriales bacterium ALC-1]|nr:hypothetical protein FBALC1_16912 [Flavobacteriales bacterium ALC-1]
MNSVNTISILLCVVLFSSCSKVEKNKAPIETDKTEPIPKYISGNSDAILKAVAFESGGWNDLLSKKDIEYHFEYETSNGKADVSIERYVFSDETSFGYYKKHEVNVLPNEVGDVIQLFNGSSTKTLLNKKPVKDSVAIKTAEFVRRALYFWVVMPYKLNDPGVISKFLGKEKYNGIDYDKIEITYDSKITKKPENDIYILYINPITKQIDRFYFSLPFFGVNAPLILAEYKYKNIKGQNLATNRSYYLPNADGSYPKAPSIIQKMSNVKFNNGFTKSSIQNISK